MLDRLSVNITVIKKKKKAICLHILSQGRLEKCYSRPTDILTNWVNLVNFLVTVKSNAIYSVK